MGTEKQKKHHKYDALLKGCFFNVYLSAYK